MNKAYRQVYKDGIGWVAIAENASCVSSSKGSGTVSAKTKVEVLKNFFDLRNSVVLNNGFLLKGLFAATLFCGVFVGGLKAETSQNIQDKAVSAGGTAVYVDDGGKRFIQNKQGGYIDTEGKGLIKIRGQWYRVDSYDEKGVMTLSDGKKYVIPTGTLNAILHDDAYNPSMVKNLATKAKVPFFYNIEDTISPSDSNKLVRYDENDKKWYVYNTNGERLYLTKRKDTGKFGLHKFSELEKNSDGIPIQDEKGYYMLKTPVSSSYAAGEVERSIELDELSQDLHKLDETPDFNKNKPTRLGLVGLDGINTTPQKYTQDDKTNGKIPDGREVGDNKDGNIRLGNVAKAELDDEAVNLGQLNEKLQNVKAKNVPYVSINSSKTGAGSNYNSDGATGEDAIAIGPNAGASAENSVAIGVDAKATEKQATSLGHNAEATKLGSTAIGHGAKATGEDSYALGSQSEANEDLAIAIGFEAKANAIDSFALGSGANTNIEGSVALGSDSVADTDKGVVGFDFGTNAQSTETSSTWKSTRGAVSVGNKDLDITRQITGVAAGYADTDAVNVAQLKSGIKNVVKYDSDANDKITLGGLDNSANPKVTGGVTITNLKAGTVSKDSTDAINGSQLYTTNENITKNTNRITKNEGYITTINQKLVDFNKDSLFKVSNNGNNAQNIGLNGEIKFNAGENIELTVSNDSKGANVEYKLMKDLTGVTSIATNSQTYKFGFQDPDEDAESVIRNKDLKNKGYVTSTDLSKKADLDAENLSNKTGKVVNNKEETYVDVWKTALGIKDLNTKQLFTAKADESTEGAKIGANGTLNFFGDKNVIASSDTNGIKYTLNKALTNINSITTEDKGTLTIKAGKETYTFDNGDNKNAGTNVVTNDKLTTKVTEAVGASKFAIKGDGNTKGEVKLSEGLSVVGKTDSGITTTAENGKFTLSLNADKVKEIAGVDGLDGKLAAKANLDASNLTDDANKNKWKTALGIKDLNTKQLFTAKADESTEGAKIGANGTLNFFGDKNVIASSDTNGIKYTLNKALTNINSITTEDKGTLTIKAGKETYTFDNGDNKNAGTNVVTNDKLTTKVTEAVGASKFAIKGDGNTKGEVKLSEGLSVVGGANSELSDKNIGVVAVNNSLQVKLAKNLLGLESAEFKKGADTTTVSAEEGVSTTKTLKVTDSNGKTVAEIDNTQIKDADGKAVTNINSAINNLYTTTKGLTSDNALAVKYDSADKKEITLGGIGATDKVAIKNLASAGDINDAKNEFNAVNAGDLKTALNGVSSSITNKIDIGDFTSLSVTANGGSAKDEIKANENIDFTAKDGIKVAYDKNVNKFTFSADINSIAGNIADNDAFSRKYAMLDGRNLKAAQGFKQDVWREALGLTDANIANIFEEGKDISITKNSNNNKYTIAYKGTGSGTGTGGMTEKEVRTIIKKYIGGDNIDSSTGSTDNIVTHNVSKQETTNNKNIIAAINKINQEGIGFVHVNGGELTIKNGISENDSQANGDNSIAIGPKSQANGGNSIAIGPKSQANGENSIAIGVRNVVTGKNSGAFGDPTHIDKDNSYSVGNNNEINSNDTFVLGNKVRVGAGMEGAVVLGSNSKADKATRVSSAEVKGITYGGFTGQAKGDGMILSVGANGAERQIKNVAAGEISENSTDAVNGSQLYATNNIIGNVANSVKNVIGGNVKVNNNGEISASNIGGTDQPTINDAIASINNKINSGGKSYIVIDVPTNGGGVPIASKGSNSIVIGAGSSDNGRKNVVSVGNAKTGLNRTITNVAPGKYGTDAVNMNQLYGVAGGLSKQINDVKKKSSAGIAGAVALGMLPQSNIPGDALVSIGTGYHDSESAVALGISKTSDNARWIFKGGVSYDSQDEVTAGASVGFHF